MHCFVGCLIGRNIRKLLQWRRQQQSQQQTRKLILSGWTMTAVGVVSAAQNSEFCCWLQPKNLFVDRSESRSSKVKPHQPNCSKLPANASKCIAVSQSIIVCKACVCFSAFSNFTPLFFFFFLLLLAGWLCWLILSLLLSIFYLFFWFFW